LIVSSLECRTRHYGYAPLRVRLSSIPGDIPRRYVVDRYLLVRFLPRIRVRAALFPRCRRYQRWCFLWSRSGSGQWTRTKSSQTLDETMKEEEESEFTIVVGVVGFGSFSGWICSGVAARAYEGDLPKASSVAGTLWWVRSHKQMGRSGTKTGGFSESSPFSSWLVPSFRSSSIAKRVRPQAAPIRPVSS